MIPYPADMPDWLRLLLDISIQAALLAGVIWMVIWIAGRRLTPAWRFALWSLVLVRLCLPIAPTSELSMFSLLPNWQTGNRQTTLATNDGDDLAKRPASDNSLNDNSLKRDSLRNHELSGYATADDAGTLIAASGKPPSNLIPDSAGVEQEQHETAVATTADAMPWAAFLYPTLLLAWLIGIGFVYGRQSLQAVRLMRMRRSWNVCADQSAVEVLEACRKRLRIRRSVRLLTTTTAIGPAVVGWLRPGIVLPASLLQTASQAELEMILLHELGHIRRGDVLWGRIAQLVSAVHWFNPVAWCVRNQLGREREQACDAIVLQTIASQTTALQYATADQIRSYGQLLIRLAGQKPTESIPAPAIVPGQKCKHKRQLTRRIEVIAMHRSRRGSRLLGGLVLTCLAIAGLTVQANPVRVAHESTPPKSQPTDVGEPGDEPSQSIASQQEDDKGANSSENQDATPQNPSNQASEEPAEQPPYIIVPVTTPLQRILMRGEGATRFVLVDGDSLVSQDGLSLDFSNLNLDQFGRAVNKDLPADAQVAMRICYYKGHPEMSKNARRAPMALGKVLRSMITQYGNSKEPNGDVSVGGGDGFLEDVKALRQPEPADLKEDPVENEFGMAYPVRTILSRTLMWKEKVDCVIDVSPKIDMNPNNELTEELVAGLKALVNKVQPDQRRWLLLEYSDSSHGKGHYTPEGFEREKLRRERNIQLANELGFEFVTNSMRSYKPDNGQAP